MTSKRLRLTNLFALLIVCIAGSFMQSCGHNNDPEPPFSEENMQRVILVYAVNHSSLKFDFKNDSVEITKAMQNIDLSKYQVLVYKTVDRETTALYKFARNEKGLKEFSEILKYPRTVTSTDPGRMERVIEDALAIYPNATYDLIFWGHGTAWVPGGADNNVYVSKAPERAYGGEYNGNTTGGGSPVTSWANLDDLVRVVPDHKFDNIWFDCCYMSSIEVIYEFRNKCNYLIAYPTEVLSGGMAYDVVIPYLLRDTPDVSGAAKAFFDVYNDHGQPVTVAVMDMKMINPVVDAARAIIQSGFQVPSLSEMVNYSRMASAMLVDFVTYFSAIANENERPELAENLLNAFNDMRIYGDASAKDFRDRSWDLDKIHCVTSFYFEDSNNANTNYYKTLGWYNKVFN